MPDGGQEVRRGCCRVSLARHAAPVEVDVLRRILYCDETSAAEQTRRLLPMHARGGSRRSPTTPPRMVQPGRPEREAQR